METSRFVAIRMRVWQGGSFSHTILGQYETLRAAYLACLPQTVEWMRQEMERTHKNERVLKRYAALVRTFPSVGPDEMDAFLQDLQKIKGTRSPQYEPVSFLRGDPMPAMVSEKEALEGWS